MNHKRLFLAGFTASVTALDVCFLIVTRDSRLWLFAAIAAVIGGALSFHLIESAKG